MSTLTGELSACTTLVHGGVPFNTPELISLHPEGTYAYVPLFGTNQVLVCPILGDGSFDPCVNSGNTGDPFSKPKQVRVNAEGTFAYVTNSLSNEVSKCPVESDGTFGACTSMLDTSFGTPWDIVIK